MTKTEAEFIRSELSNIGLRVHIEQVVRNGQGYAVVTEDRRLFQREEGLRFLDEARAERSKALR